MGLFDFLRPKRKPMPMPMPTTPTHVICETYPAYVNHIRALQENDATLKPGGGLKDVQALCGHTFKQGWDKPEVILTHRYSEAMVTGNGSYYCRECVRLYRESTP